MRYLVSLILAAIVVGADAKADDHFPPESGTVFSGGAAMVLVDQCSRSVPNGIEGTWTPSQSDIEQLEPALTVVVNRHLQQAPTNEALDNAHVAYRSAKYYWRQYGGLIIGGRRVIYVNGLHETIRRALGERWRSFPARVFGKSQLVFGVEYDVATQAFANFVFNREPNGCPAATTVSAPQHDDQ